MSVLSRSIVSRKPADRVDAPSGKWLYDLLSARSPDKSYLSSRSVRIWKINACRGKKCWRLIDKRDGRISRWIRFVQNWEYVYGNLRFFFFFVFFFQNEKNEKTDLLRLSDFDNRITVLWIFCVTYFTYFACVLFLYDVTPLNFLHMCDWSTIGHGKVEL